MKYIFHIALSIFMGDRKADLRSYFIKIDKK